MPVDKAAPPQNAAGGCGPPAPGSALACRPQSLSQVQPAQVEPQHDCKLTGIPCRLPGRRQQVVLDWCAPASVGNGSSQTCNNQQQIVSYDLIHVQECKVQAL